MKEQIAFYGWVTGKVEGKLTQWMEQRERGRYRWEAKQTVRGMGGGRRRDRRGNGGRMRQPPRGREGRKIYSFAM